MATAKADEVTEAKPGYDSVDRKGAWFRSNASFKLEDPTPIHEKGTGQTLTTFQPGHYTQATVTGWVEGQWKAGVLTRYDGDPRDEGTKEVVAPQPTPKPTPAPTEPPKK